MKIRSKHKNKSLNFCCIWCHARKLNRIGH